MADLYAFFQTNLSGRPQEFALGCNSHKLWSMKTKEQTQNVEKLTGFEAGRKVFGGKAGLSVEAANRKAGDEPALMVEMAIAKPSKQYDWANKVSIRLSVVEMMVFYAVLRGSLPSAEFVHRHAGEHKVFSIEEQGSAFYVQFQTHKGYALKVGGMFGADLGLYVFKQILRHHADVPAATVLQAIDRAAAMIAKTQPKPAKGGAQ